MPTSRCAAIALALVVSMTAPAQDNEERAASPGTLSLLARHQTETEPGTARYRPADIPLDWRADQTALVICDMWDRHWCKSATARVAEMAPRVNELAGELRRQGALIIHCPSDVLGFYRDRPGRELARQAPRVNTAVPLQAWYSLDPQREAPLPIDDSDGGCDCLPQCNTRRAWSRQIDTIEIREGDAITDSAEAFYLMKQRGIRNVVVAGVHTNMCVLGRPFSIRQMVRQGQGVVLVRDLTDTMYNPRMRPFVSHFTGTDLVVEHIERHWCPTITSDQILGGAPHRFAADQRKHLVIVMAEDEYETARTLPAFARANLGRNFRVTRAFADPSDRNNLPAIALLDRADVALFSIRRRTLPKQQLDHVRRFIASRKRLVAIRTSSHAFGLWDDEPPREGLDDWPEFDQQVLGADYQGHWNNKAESDPKTWVRVLPDRPDHPVLRGVDPQPFVVRSWLYKHRRLAADATPLMIGWREGHDDQTEPVAWVRTGPAAGRVFYTMMGHPRDFELPTFQLLLRNAIYWAADLEPPLATTQPAAGRQ